MNTPPFAQESFVLVPRDMICAFQVCVSAYTFEPRRLPHYDPANGQPTSTSSLHVQLNFVHLRGRWEHCRGLSRDSALVQCHVPVKNGLVASDNRRRNPRLHVPQRPGADWLSLVDATGVERKRPTVGDVVVVEAGAGVKLGVVDQAAQSAQLGPERARGLGAARHQLALQRDRHLVAPR